VWGRESDTGEKGTDGDLSGRSGAPGKTEEVYGRWGHSPSFSTSPTTVLGVQPVTSGTTCSWDTWYGAD